VNNKQAKISQLSKIFSTTCNSNEKTN